MDFALLFIQTLNGVQLGLLLFLVASGLTLVFGILDFVNLAHGSLYMLGAFVCASLTFLIGNFLIAVVLSLPVAAAIGWAVERFLARPLYARDRLNECEGERRVGVARVRVQSSFGQRLRSPIGYRRRAPISRMRGAKRKPSRWQRPKTWSVKPAVSV